MKTNPKGETEMAKFSGRWMAAALSCAAAATAWAQTDMGNGVATLPEVVVTAMRMETPLADVPYSSQTVDRDSLLQTAPRTTPDALRGLPSVMVQKTGYGQGSPYLRGFTGFRTLMMVDGIRLNNAVFRDGPNQYWNTIDPWSVDRYEVVMGPASVLYGSDAVGGAVNAISLAPPTWNGEPAYERTLAYRGATADESSQVRAGVRARVSEQLGVAAGFTWKTFGDLRGGRDVGRQPRTGYDEWDADLRADYQFNPGATLTLAHQQVDQDDAWRTHRTPWGIDWEGLAAGSDKVHAFDQSRALTYLRLAGDDLGGAVDAYSLTLSRQAQQEDRTRVRSDDRRDETGFDVVAWGVALALESQTRFGRWAYGADYYRDVVDSYGRRYKTDGTVDDDVQGPIADDAAYDLAGAYVQGTLPLFDDALELTPGLRYTYARMDADRALDPVSGQAVRRSESWDNLAASLRLLAPFGAERRHAVFAGLSQGFRAPNLSDLTRLDGARSAEIETPVAALDPERFLSAEIGARVQTERLYAQAAAYYTWIEDMIMRTPTGAVLDDRLEVTKKNAGDGYVAGIELTLGAQIADDWHLRLVASWMDGKVDAYPTSDPEKIRDYLTRLMPLTGEFALRWQPEGAPYWIEGVLDAAEKADRLSDSDRRDVQRIPPGGTPGYAVFALRGGATLWERLDLALALENVSDEDYRIHGSGVNEPGRNLVLQAEWTF
jgi:hemoglobin/transferrin/lactoferrin receptor protein